MVELEQAALWRFLWRSGTISVHVIVDQNREDHSVWNCCYYYCCCCCHVDGNCNLVWSCTAKSDCWAFHFLASSRSWLYTWFIEDFRGFVCGCILYLVSSCSAPDKWILCRKPDSPVWSKRIVSRFSCRLYKRFYARKWSLLLNFLLNGKQTLKSLWKQTYWLVCIFMFPGVFFRENMLAIPNWYQIQSYNMLYITIVFTIVLICSASFIYQHKDIPNFGQPHPCIMQSENQYL